jgi:hypothetical protein
LHRRGQRHTRKYIANFASLYHRRHHHHRHHHRHQQQHRQHLGGAGKGGAKHNSRGSKRKRKRERIGGDRADLEISRRTDTTFRPFLRFRQGTVLCWTGFFSGNVAVSFSLPPAPSLYERFSKHRRYRKRKSARREEEKEESDGERGGNVEIRTGRGYR